MRRLVVGAVFPGHQVLARVGPAPCARVAAPAGPKVRCDDAIADGERLAGRVGGEPLTEFGYLADHFVAQGEGARQGQLAAEDVQVGSADARHPQLERGGPRGGLGEREFGQLDRPTGCGQYRELGHELPP